jgi:hypothetical protein
VKQLVIQCKLHGKKGTFDVLNWHNTDRPLQVILYMLGLLFVLLLDIYSSSVLQVLLSCAAESCPVHELLSLLHS